MREKLVFLSLVALVLALILGGCGGGEDPPPEPERKCQPLSVPIDKSSASYCV